VNQDRFQARLNRLRQFRNRPTADLSLRFMADQFKKQVEKPYKQLGNLGQLWSQLLPQELAGHTRLESFSQGVLRVGVDSSAHLYALDRLLRQGLQNELITRHTGKAIRRVQLKVSAAAFDAP
jgi:hypothetical protein